MEKELEQAIQTFGMVPEFYQQAFKQVGADFPDELVSAIKADPNKAGELVTSDKNLQQAVLSIFKSNKNAIMKYIQQQSGSMFKEGGKFDYLKKLQYGGAIVSKDPATRTKAIHQFNRFGYSSKPIEISPLDEIIDEENGITFGELEGYGGKATPNKIWKFLPPKFRIPTKNGFFGLGDFRQEFINHDGGISNNSSSGIRMQEGGKVTRKEMNEKASDRGFSKSDIRKAYRNARNAGLTRQEARKAVIGQPEEVVTEQVVERPVLINSIATPVGRAEAVAQTISARPTTNYNNTDFGVFDFNEAFGRARAAGLSEFTWNGKRYNTKLATSTPTETKQEPSPILSKFQEAIAPLVEDQRWINEHRPYWADLKKSGGKIEQENKINKKYIKDSEEAGKEASKKMSDLKKNHRAELKKIK